MQENNGNNIYDSIGLHHISSINAAINAHTYHWCRRVQEPLYALEASN